MTRIAISGVSGRMGRTVARCVLEDPTLQLAGGTVSEHSAQKDQDVGVLAGLTPTQLGVQSTLNGLGTFDVVIDFTHPDATLKRLTECTTHGWPMVICTTGFTPPQHAIITAASQQIPLILAPNTSLGIHMCNALLKDIGQRIDQDVDIEIIEAHHKHKKDAPSGTALALGETIAKAAGRDPKTATFGRQGMNERTPGTLGYSTIRAGDIVGEHTILFGMMGERIEITHRATDRTAFAFGAIKAAVWLSEQPAGLYTMSDVLA